MKLLLLLLAFTVMAGVTFSQSKKEQIEILTNRVDSLNSVLNAEKNISTEKSNKISALNTNVTKLTSELQTSKAESTSKQQKIDILQSLLKIKTDSLLLVQLELKKYNNANQNQIVNIPDAIFKSYLVNNTAINTNGDKEIQVSEASAFKGEIDCSELNISNLTGIEAFTALTSLICGFNQLTSLDVSKNTSLTNLYCEMNQLTSLDVSKNTALTTLWCSLNQLTSLDVSKNTALTTLGYYNNQLKSLDLSKNTALTSLYCGGNQITSLDLSKNTALTHLDCNGSKFDCEALKRKYGID